MKKGVVVKAVLLAALVFAVSGCNDNLLRPKAEKSKAEDKLYKVEGIVKQGGAVPAAFNSMEEGHNARTAMPNMSGISYSIEATNGETTYFSGDNTGNIKVVGTSFTLALPKGSWTIKVEGKIAGFTSACVTGSEQVTLSDENPVAQVNIAVKPNMTGPGKVNLAVEVEDASGINGVKWTLESTPPTSGFIDLSSNKTGDITIDQIESGSYTLVMEFYSGSSEDDTGSLLYIVRESVNVFDEMTTDTWSGNSPYLSSGTFLVTKVLVETFAQTTFYVGSSGIDGNSGSSPSSPLASIQAAVNKAVAMNSALQSSENTPYRILLLSDIEENEATASFANDNNNALVNIDSTEPLYLVIEPYKTETATIDANRDSTNTGRVMYIGEKANVTMNNLTITGGYITSDIGSGLSKGTGGGIYSEGKCILGSCTVSGNTAAYGGGLAFQPTSNDDGGNKLKLTGCTISDNTAEDGGGIYFCPIGSSDTISTTLELTDCTISGNTAGTAGGGIYYFGKAPKVILDGGTISGNTAEDTGGAIYNNGTLNVQGELSIPSGGDGKNDVYLFDNENNGMQAITITGNLTTGGTVATITPGRYVENVQVLQAGTDSGVTLAEQVGKFKVTAQTDGTGWTIGDNGRISSLPKYVEGATINGITGGGYTDSEIFKSGEEVTVLSFCISDHEVTQAEYAYIMGSWPDESMSTEPRYGVGDNYPAYYVSWFDTLVYCNKRSIQENLTPCYTINGSTNPDEWGEIPTSDTHENFVIWLAVDCDFQADGYRLPTEAEWEYAARGGNELTGYQYQYAGSDNINDVAWYSANSDSSTHEVKLKQPNGLGLYDMSGNLHEWCWNRDTTKVYLCGGNYTNASNNCTVDFSALDNIVSRVKDFGFRLVRTITE